MGALGSFLYSLSFLCTHLANGDAMRVQHELALDDVLGRAGHRRLDVLDDGLTEVVELVGRRSREEIREIFATADVFVAPANRAKPELPRGRTSTNCNSEYSL
mgnify:CR=1 FL=1